MYFYEIYDDTIYADFYFQLKDNEKYEIVMASAYTSFEENIKIEGLNIYFINKNLEIIQYEINPEIVRCVFFKNKYNELFKNKKKDSYINFDIPYIININIFYDKCQKHTKLKYKILGVCDNSLIIKPISNDEYFTEIEEPKGYEIVQRSKLDEKMKEIKIINDYIKKLRHGYI